MTRRNPKPIDWNDARERVERAGTRLQQALQPSPEQGRQIMEQRARILAAPVHAPGTTRHLEIVVFSLGRERFALETKYVLEIAHMADLVRLPGAPAFVAGIHHVRGEIFPVIDLLALGSSGQLAPAERRWIVVTGQRHIEFGLLAGDVHEVTALPADALLAPPLPQPHGKQLPITGVTERALVLIDGAALLRDERLFIDQAPEPQTKEQTV